MGEKTEQPTSKRRKDERKKGNVFLSKELIILLSLVAVVYTIQALSDMVLGSMLGGFEAFFGMATRKTVMYGSDMPGLFVEVGVKILSGCLPALLVTGLAAIIGTVVQTRGLVTFSKLKPDFKKLNPLSGLKNMFSAQGIMNLLKSILKITILGYIVYTKYVEHFSEIPRLFDMEFVQVLNYGAEFLMDIFTTVVIFFTFLTAAEFMVERWQFERKLKMSKQEIKEEYKQTEGDPQIKGKIKQKQREMAMGRMMESVPEADVVIRNPTHYAVAVKYEAGKNRSPVVLAKGMDYMALRIISAAEESDVSIVENRPLARGLYENVPLDREIPEEYFQPVAEVLAFVYGTGKKKKKKQPQMVPR